MLHEPQLDVKTNHYFSGGIYEREIIVPAGSLIVGKIHLYAHLAKLSIGTMSILSAQSCETLEGPRTFVSLPGEKRLGYARTDCVFSTFHFVGSETDLDVLEKKLVVGTLEEYQL
ncbi:MAG: hypothetical protein ACRERV_17015, partial [Methylococcales bacterium]